MANSRCAAKARNPPMSRHQKFTSASILFLVLMEPHELWKPSVYSVHIQAPPPPRSAIRSLPTRASWCNVRSTKLGLPGGGDRIQDRVSNKFCPNRAENTPKKVPKTQTKSNARRNSNNRSPLRKRQRTRRREVATLSSKAYKKRSIPNVQFYHKRLYLSHTNTHTFSLSLSLSKLIERKILTSRRESPESSKTSITNKSADAAPHASRNRHRTPKCEKFGLKETGNRGHSGGMQ